MGVVHSFQRNSHIRQPNPTLKMKVILAVAFGLVALASLIEACGDETALTACELLGEMAGAGNGRPGPDKEALWTASAAALGCELPDMSNGFNPQAIADWFQCIMNACDEQEGDKCLDEEDLAEAKAVTQQKITMFRQYASRPKPSF